MRSSLITAIYLGNFMYSLYLRITVMKLREMNSILCML